jgi:predicted esterase
MWCGGIAAQTPIPAPPAQRGTLIERVPCAGDPTQTFTLYLPPGYTRETRWPVLFVFDPRGRGTAAAEIFRPGAERFGWILASSNDTRSDGPWEPNQRAVAAMWPHVLQSYAVDPDRIYAAGFSGGASVAWTLASNGAPLAGIIASGGPDLPDVKVPAGVGWFGAVGRADFNFLPVKTTAARFEQAGARWRLETFDGPHQWLPAELATRAMAWFDALALDRGAGENDRRLEERARDELAYASALKGSARLLDARRAFATIARDYPRTPSADTAASELAAFDADPAFRKAARDAIEIDERERDRIAGLLPVLKRLWTPELPPAVALVRDLRIATLRRNAAGSGYAAESARRSLEGIFVQVSFYIWREFETAKEWERAAASLRIATAIHDDRPRLWFDLAAAEAMRRRKGAALEALERAVELGFRDADRLQSDERFASLRDDDGFRELVARIKGHGTGDRRRFS